MELCELESPDSFAIWDALCRNDFDLTENGKLAPRRVLPLAVKTAWKAFSLGADTDKARIERICKIHRLALDEQWKQNTAGDSLWKYSLNAQHFRSYMPQFLLAEMFRLTQGHARDIAAIAIGLLYVDASNNPIHQYGFEMTKLKDLASADALNSKTKEFLRTIVLGNTILPRSVFESELLENAERLLEGFESESLETESTRTPPAAELSPTTEKTENVDRPIRFDEINEGTEPFCVKDSGSGIKFDVTYDGQFTVQTSKDAAPVKLKYTSGDRTHLAGNRNKVGKLLLDLLRGRFRQDWDHSTVSRLRQALSKTCHGQLQVERSDTGLRLVGAFHCSDQIPSGIDRE